MYLPKTIIDAVEDLWMAWRDHAYERVERLLQIIELLLVRQKAKFDRWPRSLGSTPEGFGVMTAIACSPVDFADTFAAKTNSLDVPEIDPAAGATIGIGFVTCGLPLNMARPAKSKGSPGW